MSNVVIRITAETSQLTAQLAVAKAEFAATQRALNQLVQESRKPGVGDALKADMAKAAEAMLQARNNVTKLQEQLKTMAPPRDFQSRLEQALDIGTFLIFRDVAEQSLRAVEGAFDATIEKAEQFALADAKFAAQLGISTGQAAALSEALKGVGSSSDEYAGMTLKLERQLKKGEEGLRSLGMATRDQNNDLLNGQALMDSAIRTMQTYKAGTDQNEFALLAFGRGAKDVYDVMRVTTAAQEQYTQDMKDFGVATGTDAVNAAIKFEEQQARVKQQYEDVNIALGQHLMPTITAFTKQLADSGAIRGYEDLLMGLAETSMEVSAIIATGLKILEGAARETTDIVIGLGEATFRASTGDYAGAASAASAAWTHMRNDASNAGADIHGIFEALDADIQRFQLGVAGSASKSPYASGGRNFTPPPDFKAQAAAAKKELEEEARDYAAFEALMNSMKRDDLSTTQQIEKAKLATITQTAEEEFQSGAITAQRKYEILRNAAQREHDLTVQALNDDMRDSRTTVAQANHDANQILLADEQLKEKQAALERQLTADTRTEVQKRIELEKRGFDQIKSAEDSFVSDMFSGRVTLGQALLNVGKQFLQQEIQNDLHALTAHLLFNQQELAADKALGQAGVLADMLFGSQKAAAKTAGAAESSAISIAASKAEALSVIPSATGIAAMEAASAVAGIPIVGPALAAAAAAEMEALGAAELSLASAAGGQYSVPFDGQLTELHRNEMVMPAGIADSMRDFFSGNQRSARMSADVHHHTWNFTGDIDKLISDPSQRRRLQSYITNAMRNSVS